MIALRMSAPGVMIRYVRAKNGRFFDRCVKWPCNCCFFAPAYRIIPLGVPFKEAFSISRAVLRTLAAALHRALGVKDRCTCDSVRSLNQCQPEGLVSALHSITSETGMPKVVGLYPPQVSGALISQRRAKGITSGRPLAGWWYSLKE
jgi:hypothetical protein